MIRGMTGGPVQGISRLHGQQLARRELARSIYRPSWLARIWDDITHWLGSLVSTNRAGAPSWWGVILLVVAVASCIATVAYWLGPTRVNKRSGDDAVIGIAQRSARVHRDAAEHLAASGDYGAAIIERIRGIVADLEARDVLLRRPARTARELATEAGAAFPAEVAELAGAARGFDDVRYGGRAGTELAYRHVRDLDVRLASAAATPVGQPPSSAAQLALQVVPAPVADTDEPSGRGQ
jgi:hypothetical protein